ncbi:hypothetical protein [Maridesulfovibrio hydrothermalis]|uniref:DUF2254 domain-containing protein n=1 Tax=Maridesulfovibrio hydrothermalis AM13 = DSM 14728 TaxID=1121451 RepID=L0RAL2_9BACT|nr:hypothetical protein [Maridesulfovibrio hydrothermalis]CCO22606.1 putative Predicted protein [Maridesulfovibrio hydrothermalis AM13 = DSM 14728]
MTDEKEKIKFAVELWKAKAWNKWHWIQYYCTIAKHKFAAKFFLMILATIYISTLVLLPSFKLFPHELLAIKLNSLTDLFLALGCALLGASAIAFSFMMFAMQVNIERLPYGLFHKFSSDKKLLFYLTGSIGLAISIVLLSMIPDSSWILFAVANSATGTIAIFVLFLCGYKRALNLIDPSNQLKILLKDTQKHFQIWDKRCERAKPFYHTDFENETSSITQNPMDICRRAYFEKHPYWHNQAKEACNHAISFASKYASRGEYEISGKALNCIILINNEYVRTKGATFFSNTPFISTGYSHDNFISHSLELLRKYTTAGQHNKDERHIEQALICIRSLADIYLTIKYPSAFSIKNHANLALGYLDRAIESTIIDGMEDVLMNGLREIGLLSKNYMLHAKPEEIGRFAEIMRNVGLAKIADKKYFPVIQTATTQLSNLTINTIIYCKGNTEYTFNEIAQNVQTIAHIVLKIISDAPLTGNHSSYLGALYSPVDNQGFMNSFLGLTTELSRQERVFSDSGKHLFLNILEWLKSIQDNHTKIFNQAAIFQLPICTDLIMWTTSIIKGLIDLTKSPHCPEKLVLELNENIVGLSRAFIYTKGSRDIFSHLETNRITSYIFSCCQYAWEKENLELSEQLQEILFEWTKKAGKYETGWGIAGRGILGMCAFVLATDNQTFSEKAKEQIQSLAESFPENIKNLAINDLSEALSSVANHRYSHSEIEIALGNIAQGKKNNLLNEVIAILR